MIKTGDDIKQGTNISLCRAIRHAAHQSLPVHLPQGKTGLRGLPLRSRLTGTRLRANLNAQQRHHSQQSLRKTPRTQTNLGPIFQEILRDTRPGKAQFHAQSGRILSIVLLPASEGPPQWQHPHQQVGLHHPHRFRILPLQRTRGTSGTVKKSALQIPLRIHIGLGRDQLLRILRLPATFL